jgi:dihydrofolate reductase
MSRTHTLKPRSRSSGRMISLIVAASTNNVIGVQGELPWKLSDDLKRFKALTMGKPIVMGRLTWESIGRPLPGRQNIVITRTSDFEAAGCDVVSSPAEALRAAGDAAEIMIIGGGQIYDLFLPKAGRIYLTRVHTAVEGDAYLSELDPGAWKLLSEECHQASEKNEFDFDFRTYERP